MEFSGTVIHGDAYGRTIGYPTINIDAVDYASKGLNLKAGVYAGEVFFHTNQKKYKAAIVISLSTGAILPKLEAHLLSYSGDCYGEVVQFMVGKFIRSYQSFQLEAELISAIVADIQKINKI